MKHYFDIEHRLSNGAFPFEELSKHGINTVLLEDKGMKQNIRIFVSYAVEEVTPYDILVALHTIECITEMLRKK